MYIQEIKLIDALPHNGAAETAPSWFGIRRGQVAGQEGDEMRPPRWAHMPGPPPPCGMQKVLCRLRWQTSAPMLAGRGQADLRIHVGAIHVNLAAAFVDHGADVA
jgi:hypothetical protein